MELIDKNDVIKCINQCIRDASDDLPSCDYYHGLMTAYAFFSEYVPQIQSVDAVPVKHGDWVKGDKMKDYPRIPYKPWMRYCSECGEMTQQDDNALFEYCPHCGTRMDGKEK